MLILQTKLLSRLNLFQYPLTPLMISKANLSTLITSKTGLYILMTNTAALSVIPELITILYMNMAGLVQMLGRPRRRRTTRRTSRWTPRGTWRTERAQGCARILYIIISDCVNCCSIMMGCK